MDRRRRFSRRAALVIALVGSIMVPLAAQAAAAPGAAAAPAAAASEPPLRAAFYYPWFPQAWQQGGIRPFTKFRPSRGFYDSRRRAVVRRQIADMQYGHIQAGIASWWGRGSQTDARMPLLLSAAAGTRFRWTVYYEPEGQGDPSVARIGSDLAYLRRRYASDPSFLRRGGRFVVFVYADGADGCGMADRWKRANTVGAHVVLKVFPGFRSCASQPDGWHQYAPAVAEDSQAGHSFSISPGFYLARDAAPRLARNLARWRRSVRDMVASKAPLQLVTTFNEWGEGTAIESAAGWASGSGHGAYLDALHAAPPTIARGARPAAPVRPSGSSRYPVASGSAPCGTSAAPPATYRHVVWVWMENKGYDAIIGDPDAPYINSLAARCGLATNYQAITHPSLPNYIAATSGGTQGIADDDPPTAHPLAVPSIYSQIEAAGLTWRDYQEDAPGNCPLSSSGLYAVKHDPAPYYTGIRASCARWDVPLGSAGAGALVDDIVAGGLPAFSFITPNLCNDMHDCSVGTGDGWLSRIVPRLLAGPNYRSGDTAVVITFDEGAGSSNRIATLVLSPTTPVGARSAAAFNHYSLLRTTEEMLGIGGFLGHAGDASTPSMRAAFGL